MVLHVHFVSLYCWIVYLAKYIICNSSIYDLVPSKWLWKYIILSPFFILCQVGVVPAVVKSYINRPYTFMFQRLHLPSNKHTGQNSQVCTKLRYIIEHFDKFYEEKLIWRYQRDNQNLCFKHSISMYKILM